MKKALNLRRTLFWDIDYSKLNSRKNARFIIERVLNSGNEKDFKQIVRFYGLKKVKETAKRINYTNNKNLNFWAIIFHIPQKSFKWTKKLLTKKQGIFLRR